MEKTAREVFARGKVYTDLALEARESAGDEAGRIPGVKIREKEKKGIRVTSVEVTDKRGEEAIGKPAGLYVTLEAGRLREKDPKGNRAVAEELSFYIRELLKAAGSPDSVLVVGLGNHEVTPDSLGPRVLDNLKISGHLKEKGAGAAVSGIVPGVMAQTGMETARIIHGIVKEMRPGAVLAIDALAARSIRRLGTTVQLTDTGIHPGSGVGNHRHGLTRESLGVPVIAIGVPTVVGAAAIVHDTISALIQTLASAMETKEAGDFLESLDPDQQYQLIRELLEPEFGSLYVTPPDIDQTIQKLGVILAEAIHLAFCPQTSQNSPGIHI